VVLVGWTGWRRSEALVRLWSCRLCDLVALLKDIPGTATAVAARCKSETSLRALAGLGCRFRILSGKRTPNRRKLPRFLALQAPARIYDHSLQKILELLYLLMETGAPVIFQLGPRWDIMVQQRVRTDSWPFQVRHGALKKVNLQVRKFISQKNRNVSTGGGNQGPCQDRCRTDRSQTRHGRAGRRNMLRAEAPFPDALSPGVGSNSGGL